MKHIEGNFKRIIGNQIPKEELNILKPFLTKLKSFSTVDCVYLVPTFQEIEYGRESFDYFYKQFYIIFNQGNTSDDYKQIQALINKVRSLLKNTGYFFVDEYDFFCVKQFDQNYSRSLVSSYILFDRNGIYEKMQDEIQSQVVPFQATSPYFQYGSVAEIENIDELNTMPKEKAKQFILMNQFNN